MFQRWKYSEEKKIISTDLCQSLQGERVACNMPVVDSDWKFEATEIIGNYRGTTLAHKILCEPIR